MARLPLALSLVVALGACSSHVDLAGSCGGGQDATCAPYAFSVVTVATLSPAGLQPGDLGSTARVHIELMTCGAAGPRHSVIIKARANGSSPIEDGGTGDTVYTLATVADDGTRGDAHADDGVIDAVIPNPFDYDLAGNATVDLVFTPHAEPLCDGTPFTLTYTTGAPCAFVPPMGCASAP